MNFNVTYSLYRLTKMVLISNYIERNKIDDIRKEPTLTEINEL